MKRETLMKTHRVSSLAAAAALLVLSGTVALSQEHGRGDDQDRQASTQKAARDWYNQHQDHPPKGFRKQDQLSADEESRLREGAPLDRSFRQRTHSVPRDLSRTLPKASRGHRYVVVGGHVVMMDNKQQVESVIHLHDNR
jgi:Ni/Co efflux regulator RcnB